MARPERSISPEKPSEGVDAEGVDAEGMESYPTYRDGPVNRHAATSTKPTDVGLPRSQRTSAIPMLIGLIAFAMIVIGLIAWATFRTAATPEGLTPPETPSTIESTGTSDAGAVREIEPAAQTGPGEIEASPAPADVPGGETTTPVAPEPSQ